jgi:phage terminase large subunit
VSNTSFRFDNQVQPKQLEALKVSKVTPVLFYGGAKGGGKSYLTRFREVRRRLRYPNTKGLIVRRTYPELLSNHIRKFFEEYPETRGWYNKSEKILNYPNGSTTEFSYLKNTDDVFTYQGREYEDISVDEITQHEEQTFKILRTSLRTTNASIQPRMLLTGNPGGIGHAWVKRLFIDKSFRAGEMPDDYAFIQAFVSDNTALLKADPDYVRRLEDLPEHLRKAYLEGDWNIFAGQAFPELSPQTHIVQPFALPPGTKYFFSFDPGYNHPYCFIVFALVPEGTLYVTNVITGRLQMTMEIAEKIKSLNLKGEIYSGQDLWYPGRGGGKSLLDEFSEYGINAQNGFYWIRAKTDRVRGVQAVRKYVNPKGYPDGKPRVFFFSNTQTVYDCVASMQIDPKNPEDVVKVDALDGDGGDDAYDAFRYGVISRVFPNSPADVEPEVFSGDWVLQTLQKQREEEEEWV